LGFAKFLCDKVGIFSCLYGFGTGIQRLHYEQQASHSQNSLNTCKDYHPEGSARAILLGLQILFGTLCFLFGCVCVGDADKQLSRGHPRAIRNGVIAMAFVIGGLTLYACGTVLLANG